MRNKVVCLDNLTRWRMFCVQKGSQASTDENAISNLNIEKTLYPGYINNVSKAPEKGQNEKYNGRESISE